MRNKLLSPILCFLILVLSFSTLTGCGKTEEMLPASQTDTAKVAAEEMLPASQAETAKVTAEEIILPSAKQKADFLIPDGIPSNWESYQAFYLRFMEKLSEKQAELDAAAAAAGLSENTYYEMLRNDVECSLIMPVEIYDSLKALKPEELVEMNKGAEDYRYLFETASVSCLMTWSALEDLIVRADGYTGLCTALCEGKDVFQLTTDARDITEDSSLLEQPLFNGLLPPLDMYTKVLLCDERLSGYGMENPAVYAIASDKIKEVAQAEVYVQSLREKGLYIMGELFNGTEDLANTWYGTWVGDDGTNLFVYVAYVGSECEEGNEYIENFAKDCHFLILASNFDFTRCANVAMQHYFG